MIVFAFIVAVMLLRYKLEGLNKGKPFLIIFSDRLTFCSFWCLGSTACLDDESLPEYDPRLKFTVCLNSTNDARV